MFERLKKNKINEKMLTLHILLQSQMGLASSAGISHRVIQIFFPNTHSQAKTHRDACGGD
jgi:hypothetical protein